MCLFLIERMFKCAKILLLGLFGVLFMVWFWMGFDWSCLRCHCLRRYYCWLRFLLPL
jgi:hypothetical protein